MAAVDLTELIPNLEAAITVPGEASPFAATSEDEWIRRLNNGFWDAFNDGLLASTWRCSEDAVVTPVSGDATFGRDLQQIVILYAAMAIVQQRILQLKTLFRAKAGEAEYETQQSAQVLKTVLDQMLAQKTLVLDRLADGGAVNSRYVDSVRARDYAYRDGLLDWVNN